MTERSDAPRDLLFGLLALQNGLIDQGQLFSAFAAWSRNRDLSMAEILANRGDLEADDRLVVEALVARHLKKHGGDTEKSLAAIQPDRSILEGLADVGSPAIDATLAHFGSGLGSTDAAPTDQTGSYAIGPSTSHGQRFRVLRPHAQGGLGAVYVALDGELNREVALKEILGHHADDATTRLRFLLEAEITGGLEHPGIVPVYGLGSHPDGRPYYAMRFIRGDSLKEAIADFHADETLKHDPGKKAMALRGLLGRLIDVCNAIGYAHARGVLHRDIKPSNIILGNHGETLVVNWGLAKASGHHEPGRTDERTLMPSSGGGSADTLPGSAIGTPAYMSPEQAVGDVDHIGPASDVYSLGGTLYCLLTGKTPHEGKDFGTILRDIHKGNFPAPRTLDPSIPRPLEAVCLKAMATSSEDRYPSCRAMADDLERWLADEAVSAWREPWPVRARRWASRRRTLVTVAVGTTALAAVVSTLSAWATARALLNERQAMADMTRALAAEKVALQETSASEGRSTQMMEVLIRQLAEDLAKVPGAEGVRRRLLEEAANFYDKAFLSGQSRGIFEYMNWAASAYNVGRIRRQLGDDAKALEAFGKARTRYRELVERQPDFCNAWDMIGNCALESVLILWGEQRLREAEAEGREGAKALAEAARLVDPNTIDRVFTDQASMAANLGLVLVDLGRLDEARPFYGQSLELRRGIIAGALRTPGTTGTWAAPSTTWPTSSSSSADWPRPGASSAKPHPSMTRPSPLSPARRDTRRRRSITARTSANCWADRATSRRPTGPAKGPSGRSDRWSTSAPMSPLTGPPWVGHWSTEAGSSPESAATGRRPRRAWMPSGPSTRSSRTNRPG